MTNKFNNIPEDEGTRILNEEIVKIAQLDALHQKWVWEGTIAESLIFDEKDVKHLNDEELKKLVRSTSKVNPDSSLTISRSGSGYVFVNFNFVSPY